MIGHAVSTLVLALRLKIIGPRPGAGGLGRLAGPLHHHQQAMAMALVGRGFMLAGALGFPRPVWERPITLVGGFLLTSADILNWRRRYE